MNEVIPAPPSVPLRRTPLWELHESQGAHWVPFHGWEMPLYYQSILGEHRAVRSAAGLFDVSHMGLLVVRGETASRLLSRRTTANVARISLGQARYTFWLDSDGHILDDMLIERLDDASEDQSSYLVIPNAGRAERISELLKQQRRPDIELEALNGRAALLALQGPTSRRVLEAATGWSLEGIRFYHSRRYPLGAKLGAQVSGVVGCRLPQDLATEALVSRTGYTGELGYEILVSADASTSFTQRLLDAGAVLAGLGARDTLRLEKGYLLSGQDFSRDRTPLETGYDRFVEFDHLFVGREALERQQKDGVPVKLTGLTVGTHGAIPRHGTPIFSEDKLVTHVTSGGLSPSLGVGIALAYLPPSLAATGTRVEMEARSQRFEALATPLPFYPPPAAGAA
jgi:glycine cleavage system T protein (aminomethyltransferase)